MIILFTHSSRINKTNLNFKGSPWRDQISNGILLLQEKGDLQELYTKWWEKEDRNYDKKCEVNEDKKKDSASELSFASVGGIFLVLAVGLCLSFLVALFEFFWKARQLSDDKVSGPAYFLCLNVNRILFLIVINC